MGQNTLKNKNACRHLSMATNHVSHNYEGGMSVWFESIGRYQYKMKLGITFGDNDFGVTFREVLRIIQTNFTEADLRNLSEDQLCNMINELVYGVYLVAQNQFRYKDKNPNFIKNYLKIDFNRILFDDEVDKLLDGDTNAEFHVMVLDDKNPHNNIIFST